MAYLLRIGSLDKRRTFFLCNQWLIFHEKVKPGGSYEAMATASGPLISIVLIVVFFTLSQDVALKTLLLYHCAPGDSHYHQIPVGTEHPVCSGILSLTLHFEYPVYGSAKTRRLYFFPQ